jgi:fatty-acyl-CoA synthase
MAEAMLISNMVRASGLAVAPRVAATVDDDAITFGELDLAATQVARALAAAGVGPGDRVAWWGDTSIDAVRLFAGAARLGAVFCPVNARLSRAEAEQVIAYAQAALVLRDDGFDLGAVGSPTGDILRAAAKESSEYVAPTIDERDPHVIFFTSGSTGAPKGVVLSHRANYLRSYPGANATSDGGTVCMFPLFHMAGWSMAMGAWQSRQPIHFVKQPTAPNLLETTQRFGAERLYAIPAVWGRLLDHGFSAGDIPSVRFADTGTSATPPELVTRIRATLPLTETRVFYGSTEAGSAAVLSAGAVERKPGTVGLPAVGAELRCDETTGFEVWVRSSMLMDGYFNLPEATAETLAEGWYHTGDLGSFDEDRYLSIVGRVRDVIRTGGETVSPREVEAACATHPAVHEVAIVGMPDPQWGEVVCACVVLAPGSELTLEALRAHCDATLAGFKVPRRLAFVDELPRTPATGQIQRTLLVERIGLRG